MIVRLHDTTSNIPTLRLHDTTNNLPIIQSLLTTYPRVREIATLQQLRVDAMRLHRSLKVMLYVQLQTTFHHPWVLQTVQHRLDLHLVYTRAVNHSKNSNRYLLPRMQPILQGCIQTDWPLCHHPLKARLRDCCQINQNNHHLYRRLHHRLPQVQEATHRLVLLPVQLL